MAEITNQIIYDVLKNVQGELSAVKADVSMLKESVRRIDARMGAIENLMAGFHNTLNWHGQELDEHREKGVSLIFSYLLGRGKRGLKDLRTRGLFFGPLNL